MRTLVIIFSVVGLITLNSCKQEPDVQALLQNSETRSELIKGITENHDFMMEFMQNMQGNEHSMKMMQGNKKMMGNMMSRHAMMQEMMKDGGMMGNMMKMMHEKGMMSEDCMQSCMKMMGDKGMDMMNGDDEGAKTNEGDHFSHH